jgi:hypothetical protein
MCGGVCASAALLYSLIRFLVEVSKNSEINKMTPENLAIVSSAQPQPPSPSPSPRCGGLTFPLLPLSCRVQVFAPNLLRPAQETANTMLYDMPIAINIIASFILHTDEIFTQPPLTAVQHSNTNTFAASFAHPTASSSSSSSSAASYAMQPASASLGSALSSTLPGPMTTAGKRSYNSQTL